MVRWICSRDCEENTMPVDAVSAGANPIVDNYTIGANAKAKEEAKTLATTKE